MAEQYLIERVKADLQFLAANNYLAHADIAPVLNKLGHGSPYNASPMSMPAPQHMNSSSNNNNVYSVSNNNAPPPPPRQEQAPPPPQPQKVAKALWAYTPNAKGDLGFKKDDIIEITEQINEHWYRGNLEGRSGLFPANHVEILPTVPNYSLDNKGGPYTNGQIYQTAGANDQNAVANGKDKKNFFGGKHGDLKKTFATAAVGGAGFGAASSLVSGIL